MSDDLIVEVCPETGMGSVVRRDLSKIDLLPVEVDAIKAAGGDDDAIRRVIADSDSAFAASLTAEDLAHIKALLG